jgi:hypothetical protein
MAASAPTRVHTVVLNPNGAGISLWAVPKQHAAWAEVPVCHIVVVESRVVGIDLDRVLAAAGTIDCESGQPPVAGTGHEDHEAAEGRFRTGSGPEGKPLPLETPLPKVKITAVQTRRETAGLAGSE